MAKAAGQPRQRTTERRRRKSATIAVRVRWLKSSVIKALKNAEIREKLFAFLFWVCLLLSLTPLIFSFKGIFGSFAIAELLAVDAAPLPGWVADPKFSVFLTLAGLMASCAVALRIPTYILASLTPVVAAFLGLAEPAQPIFVPLTLAYCLLAFISLAIFGLRGRFLSPAVAIFAIFSFFDSAAIILLDTVHWISFNIFGGSILDSGSYEGFLPGYLLDDYGASIVDLISFFVLLVSLRFSVHLVNDNKQIAGTLWAERKNTREALISAVGMWWPLAVAFIVLTVWAYPKFDAFVENRTMTWLQNMLICEPANEMASDCIAYEPARATAVEFEPMMRVLVDYSAAQVESTANQAIQDIANLSIQTADDLKHTVYPILATKVLPERMPGTNTRGCRKLNIPCHGANGAKSLANSGYRRLRDPPLRALERQIENAYVFANGNVEAFRQETTRLIQQEVINYRVRANIAIDKTVYGLKLIAIFSFLYSLMVLIKTYGIAFSRVIFDYKSRYTLFALLAESDRAKGLFSSDRNIVAVHKNSPLILSPEEGLNYYIQGSRQVASGLSFPWPPFPFKGIRKRLFAKNYVMQFYNLTGGSSPDSVAMHFGAMERLISVKIRQGDRFVFDFPNVVAFSTGIKVKTFVTLSLHGLVFGKALYRIAEGEGVIIFYIEGEPTVLSADDYDLPEVRRDAKSLVAWRLDTPFRIQSKLTMAGLLASGYNIAKQDGGAAVIHNNQITNGSAKMGVARFVRTFLSPV